MESLAENWSVIDNNYFIKYHFFNMSWNITDHFKDYIISYEENGGSIAVIPKPSLKQTLIIYSSSGKVISSKQWQDAPVIGLHWSENENVLLLQKSGRVAIYTLQCEYITYVSLGYTVKQNLVKSFNFFTSLQGVGLMVLAETNEFYFKTNITKADSIIKSIKPPKQLLNDGIADWFAFTDLSDREIVAVIANKSDLIKFKYNNDPRFFNLSSTIVKLAISMSQSKIAVAMINGSISCISSDFSRTILDFNFDFKINDQTNVQMEWAGEDFLVMYYDQSLYLMDSKSQSTNIFYLDNPLFFPEIDGVRLITPTKHEFIQKIPHELEQLCELGEECPAAWLFDAQRHLENKSSDAINYLEQVLRKERQLQKAIDVCLLAASHCLEPKWQKTILHTVRLGRSYLPDYKSDLVTDIHNKLTLINNLKLPFIAMPLTFTQLNHLTMPVLLDRLNNRQYFPFIERICLQLRISKDQGVNRMLEYWAENFIKRNENEEMLSIKIIERLKNISDFNFAKIAGIAYDMKKYILAEKLLEKEGRIEHQVNIWLKLKKNSLALSRAIESGNCDLISFVVSKLNRDMNNQEFFILLSKYPIAKTIYIEQLAQSESVDWEKSKKALDEIEDNPASKAKNNLKASIKSESLQSSLSTLISVQDQYKKLNSDFIVQTIDEQRTLIQHQIDTCSDPRIDSSTGVIMSLHNYLSYLFDHNLDERAETVKQKLKVSDRQFYWLRLQSFAKNELWNDFDKLIVRWNKKMPVSYYDIADMCADYGNEPYVFKYIDKVEQEKRVKLLVKIDKMQEAEELARVIKDDTLINYVTAMKFKIV